MPIEKRISIGTSPIKDNAALHGADIGKIYEGVEIYVDTDRIHDNWFPIVGPGDLGPTWKKTGKQGWIEVPHARKVSANRFKYMLVTDENHNVISCTRVG